MGKKMSDFKPWYYDTDHPVFKAWLIYSIISGGEYANTMERIGLELELQSYLDCLTEDEYAKMQVVFKELDEI